MRRSIVPLLALALLLASAAPPAAGADDAAQERAPTRRDLAPAEPQDLEDAFRAGQDTPETVAGELEQLNRTLARIAELLERQTEGQRLDLALKRLEVETNRVARLEEELRREESRKESMEDEELMIRNRLETMAERMEDAEAETSIEALEMFEQQVAQAQRTLERRRSQAEEAERRILELENELTRRRGDLRALQDRLDRQLDGM